ncbi:MAG: hypothetical protein R3A45_04030 [Bdellovibrionota bacterium]
MKNYAISAIEEIIPKDQPIDLLVMSRPLDHTESTVQILQDYQVKKIIRTGYRPDRKTQTNIGDRKWESMDALIRKMAENKELEDINLSQITIDQQQTYTEDNLPEWIGQTLMYADNQIEVKILSGFGSPLPSWEADLKAANEDSNSYRMNMSSIVIRLEYMPGDTRPGDGKSVLFMGDALGRFFDDDAQTVRFTEKLLIDRFGCEPWDMDCYNYLASSVLIMGHHGAANASAKTFIENVRPQYAIAPSGHSHDHPAKSSMNHMLDFFITQYGTQEEALNHIYRTDIGDDERLRSSTNAKGQTKYFGVYEWDLGRIDGHRDEPGDNDVYIVMPEDGSIHVSQDGRN